MSMVNTFISNRIYFQLSFCRIALREIGFIGFIGLAFDECGFHSINPPFEDRFLELSIRNSIICHSRRMRYVAVVARLNLHRLFYVDNPSEVSFRVSDFYVKTYFFIGKIDTFSEFWGYQKCVNLSETTVSRRISLTRLPL